MAFCVFCVIAHFHGKLIGHRICVARAAHEAIGNGQQSGGGAVHARAAEIFWRAHASLGTGKMAMDTREVPSSNDRPARWIVCK